MNILVSGCCWVYRFKFNKKLLQDGHSVIGLDNFLLGTYKNMGISSNKFKFIEVDIAEEDCISYLEKLLVDKYEIHEIWHLAANSDIQKNKTQILI